MCYILLLSLESHVLVVQIHVQPVSTTNMMIYKIMAPGSIGATYNVLTTRTKTFFFFYQKLKFSTQYCPTISVGRKPNYVSAGKVLLWNTLCIDIVA